MWKSFIQWLVESFEAMEEAALFTIDWLDGDY